MFKVTLYKGDMSFDRLSFSNYSDALFVAKEHAGSHPNTPFKWWTAHIHRPDGVMITVRRPWPGVCSNEETPVTVIRDLIKHPL